MGSDASLRIEILAMYTHRIDSVHPRALDLSYFRMPNAAITD
jgi:hypothetical protein